MNITCTIDSREKERIPYAKNFFNNYYPLAVELETGDYMFENIDTDECVIFEYKTINDFIGSVRDGRIFEQVKRMNEEFDWSFIVIDGTIDDLIKENRRRMIYKHTGKPFHLKQYYSAIARLNCYTTVTQCYNQAQSFQYMEKQVLKIFDDKPLIKHFKKDSDNPAVNYLAGIQGVNYKTAELIISAFNINSLRDLLNIVENEDLTLVKGIGEKKARLIEKNIIM
jgi:DNA excision repair protein ERCC-4